MDYDSRAANQRFEHINIYLSSKYSNTNELIYYSYWKNNYYYNIYERLDKLTNYLIKCEEAYYLAKPLIPDSVYDYLLKELKQLEIKLDFSYSNSPTKNIGRR